MPEARSSASTPARRTLFEERSPVRTLHCWVGADSMTAGLTIQLSAGPWPDASAEELGALLERHGVIYGLEVAGVEEVAAAARAGQGPLERIVAKGTPVEPGSDGALEFLIRPSSEGARYQCDPATGRIDYRETNLIENVLSGEGVAIEIPPRPGRDGRTVFGRPLAAAVGKPARFALGEGVRFDEGSRQVIAERDGRAVWENGKVSVSGTYHVRGSVDYSVGNVAFVGEVIVDGDVLDGFNVRSGAGLTVGGNVGACRLDSEGDLVVKGGVFGKGRARLRSKGMLRARILNDCQAEAAGPMIIERETVGATLLSNRYIMLLSGGSLVGGTASALGGLEAETIGSPLGVPTSVSVGTDFNVARRQGEAESRVVEVDNSVEKISGFLTPMLADRRRLAQILTKRREDIEKLVRALRELRAERARLANELEALAEASHRGAVRQINVRRTVHPGVTIEIGSVRHRVKQPIGGPVSIFEDRAQASLRTSEFKDLPKTEAEGPSPKAGTQG